MRFQRLFGDTKHFALTVALRDDPAPPHGASEALRQSWGELQIWSGGVCLTQHTQPDGTSGQGIAWYLLPLLEWFNANAVPLLNCEPFVFPIPRDEGGTALAWLDSASEGPPARAIGWNEEAWFDERYAFWKAHALRAALPGAAVPHIVFHRIGDDIEVSWDNESAPPARPGLVYSHSRGARIVGGAYFAEVVSNACCETLRWLKGLVSAGEPHGALANLSNGCGPAIDAWRWLIPKSTAEQVRAHSLLASVMPKDASALNAFIQHNLATSLLRAVDDPSGRSLDIVSRLLKPPSQTLNPQASGLRRPATAARWDAWKQGYVAALQVRERLGWKGPVTKKQLPDRISQLGIEIADYDLSEEVACGATAYAGDKARIVVNNRSKLSPSMRLATALGHYVLDTAIDRDFGVLSSRWMDTPTVARAKAFGAMLLMPEDDVRALAKQVHSPDALLKRVMSEFETTRQVTAWHLFHLRLIDQEDLDALGLIS